MPDNAVPLTLLAEGERVRVMALARVEDAATAHLFAAGVLPGAELTLLQRYPAFIFVIGHTEFAVDAELAGRIQVQGEPRQESHRAAVHLGLAGDRATLHHQPDVPEG